MMNAGHFYGKVLDSLTGKPVEFASVQLWADKKDSVTKQMKPNLITGMITQSNGDFSFEGLAVLGKFTLKVTFIGYNDFQEKIAFNFDMNKMMDQAQSKNKDVSGMINAVDKDLGNIKLSTSADMLKAVVIDGSAPVMELKFDKKVFNVEKNITTAGGTAEDVLKNVPSVNVDIDGNVTMRNAAPQIFVDGKPTTLTLDQIPADGIESVELITNPSAKYDASGGGGGILNIVMKKARKVGYNGNLRAGVDMRGKVNVGGDISSRQGKINVFLSATYNQRKSIMTGEIDRENLFGSPLTNVTQTDNPISIGYFAFVRGGFDWFLDNRNTITISGSYPTGSFSPTDVLNERTDTLSPSGQIASSSFYTRNSNSKRTFNNPGGALQYKHIFPKAGKELTADFNYNGSAYTGTGLFDTQYHDAAGNAIGNQIVNNQVQSGTNKFFTVQSDYVNPIGENMKIETGVRAAIRSFISHSNSFIDSVSDEFQLPGQKVDYSFTDKVYAGYVTFSQKVKKFSYQVGIRAESSQYNGELLDSNQTFQNQYPLSVFPSGNATYNLSDKSDLQVSFSRRVNRPNFRQLIPFIDYSDSLNLSSGNPNLKPEFTNSFELSYLRNFDRANNVLVSLWYRNTTDLISRFQIDSLLPGRDSKTIINTYENANSATAYGLELTGSNTITKWFTLVSNVNFYNSTINGTNLQNGLTNNQFSWFGKLNGTFKLPKNFSLQLIGNYQSQTALPISQSGGGQMFGGGGSQSTLQGYQKPTYGVDGALKYEFWKNKAASLTLNCSDIFKTRETQIYSTSPFFIQNTTRTRDPQFFRLNFSYRFGKFDVSLFKRKNTKVNTEGLDNIQE